MANLKISALPAGSTMQATDLLAAVQDTATAPVTNRVTLNQVAAIVQIINGVAPTPAVPVDFKDSVVVATTANITLSGEQTLDGVLTSASRVLVWQQTNAAQNGIYVSAAGAWSRSTDADTSAEVTPGMLVLTEQGTLYGNLIFGLDTAGTITLDTTLLTFSPKSLNTVYFPNKNVAGTTYTGILQDSGRRLNFTNAGTKTFTVPPQTGGGGVAYAVNTEIDIFNQGAGLLTIAAGAGVTINAAALTVPVNTGVKLKKSTNPNTWNLVFGVGGAVSLSATNVFTKSNTVADVALTDAATVAIDYSLSNNFYLLLTSAVGATRALGLPTNPTSGAQFVIKVKQPASGGPCALTYHADITWGTGGVGLPPTLSQTANAVDVLGFVYDIGTAKWRGSMISTVTAPDRVTSLAIAAGVVNIDLALGDYFTLSLTANVTSITFSNLPGTSYGANKQIEIIQGPGPYTVAWPASFKWVGGVAGAVSTVNAAVDTLNIITLNNGTTWKATLAKAWA